MKLSGSREQSNRYDPGPVWGCVLIGGKSSRMGVPKHLIKRGEVTWLELIFSRLRERTDNVVIAGAGSLPDALRDVRVVEDAAGIQGPLAGIVSVFRAYPEVSWLVAACDMPDIELAALDWLLNQRGLGVKAILPDIQGKGMVEPLLAYYDRSCRELLEEIVSEGGVRPGVLAGGVGVITPMVPAALQESWNNFNSLADVDG